MTRADLSILIVFLAGCGSLPTMEAALESQKIPAAVEILKQRKLPAVAVVVSVSARGAEELTEEKAKELGVELDAVTGEVMDDSPDRPRAYAANPAILADTLVEGLRTLGIFEDVYAVGAGVGGEGAHADRFFLQKEATERGAAFLVEFKLSGVELLHLGGSDGLSTLVWFLGGLANSWMRNETFRLSMTPSARIYDINAAEFLPEIPLGSAEATLDLNFHERTSSLRTYGATVIWPSNYTRPDADKVTTALAPAALAGAIARFAVRLADLSAGREFEFEILDNQNPALTVAQNYPPPGKRALVLTDRVHLELAFQATEQNLISEVKMNELVIWPMGLGPDEPVPVRSRFLFEAEPPVVDRKMYSFTVTDTAGNVSRYALRARKLEAQSGTP